jgi:hypothetical protein
MAQVDWTATGTMLQGIGTITGALAVITAALVGGNTFRAWRRQQLIQRHMGLAERILVTIFRARERIGFIRSPLKTGAELEEASKVLEANGFKLERMSHSEVSRLTSAQASLSRVNRYNETWLELEACKASAYAHFGDDIPREIDRILHQVHSIRVDADASAEDDGSDQEFSRGLRNTLSSSRARGEKDVIAEEVNGAISAIEARLRPLLQEVASQTEKILTEVLKASLEKTLTLTIPWFR